MNDKNSSLLTCWLLELRCKLKYGGFVGVVKTTKDYQRLSKTTKGYQRLPKTIKDYQRLSKWRTKTYSINIFSFQFTLVKTFKDLSKRKIFKVEGRCISHDIVSDGNKKQNIITSTQIAVTLTFDANSRV